MATETIELPPVTYEQIRGIFSSRDFLKGIRRASIIMNKVGFESQFTLWREARKRKIVYLPHESTAYSLPDSTTFEITDKQQERIAEHQVLPLLAYHCHPISEVMPSEEDIQNHVNFRRQYGHINEDSHTTAFVTNHHISCIGANLEQGRFHDVLIYQNRALNVSLYSEGENVRSQIEERLKGIARDNAAIARALDSLNNWNAVLLTYERRGTVYAISDSQLSRLERFAYTPTIESETEGH